jgi:outer membrane lipoprotein carrier protein
MRTTTIVLFLCAAFLLALLPPAAAGTLTAELQKQYRTISGFRADFTQNLTNAASGETETRKGKIAFMKPRCIRWKTISPEPELLVVNREEVWEYFPAEDVAYRYSLRGVFESKTMLRFVTGEVDLREDFSVEVQGEDDNGWTKLKLTPKNPEPSLVQASVWVDPERTLLRRIVVEDFFGNRNRLTFENIELDPKLKTSLFEFDPPEDVEVVDNTTEGARQ